MEIKRSRIRPLLLTLALLATPAVSLAQTAAEGNPAAAAPDNTGVNARDRDSNAVTPFSQSNKRSDVETTRRIRRSLMRDKTLSTTAKNVKVVTVDGRVILRGPVKSEQEKIAIADKAQHIVGAGKVDNQLEISGR
jgi:hyperosmotically inducible periplasmic protein